MCMHTIENSKFDSATKTGYKVFLVIDNEIYPSHRNIEAPYKLNEWYNAKASFIVSNDLVVYPGGFHIFTNEQDARDYMTHTILGTRHIVYKVSYRWTVAKGKHRVGDDYRECHCAAKMKIEERV